MFGNLFRKKPKITSQTIDQDEVMEYSVKVASEAHFLALEVIKNAGASNSPEYSDVMKSSTFALFFLIKRGIRGEFGEEGNLLFDLMLKHMINCLLVHIKPTIPLKSFQDQSLKYYYADQDEYMKCRKWTPE